MTEKEKKNSKIKDYVLARLQWLMIALALCTISGYLSDSHYFELTCHFRFQYFCFCLLFFLLFLYMRSWRHLLFCSLFLLINLVEIWPWYIPMGNTHSNSSIELKLLLANVYTANNRYQQLIDLVEKKQPDLLILEEINGQWLKHLSALKTIFPYRIIKARSDNFGIALYSRYPISNADIIHLGKVEVPAIRAQIQVKGKKLELLAAHPLPPLHHGGFILRNKQLQSIADFALRHKKHCIIIGDLNTTMWSPYYKKLISDTHLKNSRRNLVVPASWPVGSPIQIPIDHCLHSPDLKTIECSRQKDIGSDHYPLFVKIAIQ